MRPRADPLGPVAAGDQSAGLPTVGDMLREITAGAIDGAAYDTAWPARAAETLW